MKRPVLFLVILILSTINVGAQPYQSLFGSDSTSWTFAWLNLDFGGTEIAYVSKDTVIDGLTYKKINYYNNGDPSAFSAPCVLREDTATGKVWFRSLDPYAQDTADLLAFDFSLMQGDSFDIGNMQTGRQTYSKVDSVRYIGGLKYIYFDVPYESWDPNAAVASEPYMIIEGIGSNMSPLWKQFIGGYRGHYLLCSSKNGVRTSYTNIRYAGQCATPPLAIEEKQIERLNIRLAPNPAGNMVAILSEGRDRLVNIALHDIVGRLFFSAEKVKIGSKAYSIDISKLSPGIYTLSVTDEHGISNTLRLVKQ